MSLGSVVGNGVLLACIVAAIWSFAPDARSGLVRGAIAAIVALIAFTALRGAGAAIGRPLPTERSIVVLVLVAIVEETAKYLAVRLPRRKRRTSADSTPQRPTPPGGIETGIGFAAFENLTYLMLPFGLFSIRVVAAGAFHVATTVAYAHLRTRRAYLSWIALAVAILAHIGYNGAIAGLDEFLTNR
jgi:RsiW-degrading membrane proteinase PrsW (M82 family)